MLVETNNFRAICHSNKIVYLGNPRRFTPKAGQCLHGRKVPILYNHNSNDVNGIIGIAELRWCSDDCKIDAVCELNDNAKKYLIGGLLYSLDACMTNLKLTHTDKIQNYVIREVSIVTHENLPEHEEIIFNIEGMTKIPTKREPAEKLKKIEQIIKDYDNNCGLEEYMYLEQIKEVLDNE